MITDQQFAEILKPLGFAYDTARDTIYLGGCEIVAYVASSIHQDDWERGYLVERIDLMDLNDERTLALRAMCVLHEIEVQEFEDNDH